MLSTAELPELHRLLQSAGFATVPTYSPLRIADGFIQPVIDLLGGILRRHGA